MALVFSVDNPDSLEGLEEKWRAEVEHFCPGILKVVIGCKNDLRAKDSVCVDTQAGIELAKRLGARHYIECSAQKYVGIEELLERVGSMAWEIYERSQTKQPAPAGFELQATVPG
ncbi:GTP-binding protein Rho1 [Ceratobasidium sp. 395]|nr:GTP-binding protein Rho1 [Ceratobasidium sp. 395]